MMKMHGEKPRYGMVLQQIKVIQLMIISYVRFSQVDYLVTHLIVILHDSPLPSACIHPRDEILHMSCNEHGGIGYRLWTNTDMSLFYRPNGLGCELDTSFM